MNKWLICILFEATVWTSSVSAGQPDFEWHRKMVQKQYPGWSFVLQSMLSGPQYKDYSGATGELTLGDKSRVVLIFKKEGERIKYQVIRVVENGTTISLIRDSWADGNPVPFLMPNREISQKDIKTKKIYKISIDRSVVFDEWAYRWVLAEVKGKWIKILVQSEE